MVVLSLSKARWDYKPPGVVIYIIQFIWLYCMYLCMPIQYGYIYLLLHILCNILNIYYSYLTISQLCVFGRWSCLFAGLTSPPASPSTTSSCWSYRRRHFVNQGPRQHRHRGNAHAVPTAQVPALVQLRSFLLVPHQPVAWYTTAGGPPAFSTDLLYALSAAPRRARGVAVSQPVPPPPAAVTTET